MKERIAKLFNHNEKDIFRIKKVLKYNGTIFIPQVKRAGPFTAWEQITEIYGKYYLIEVSGDHLLDYNTCIQHIEGYKAQRIQEEIEHRVEIDYKLIP